MDLGESLSKEHVGDGCGQYNGQIFQIKDFDLVNDTQKFLPVFWQAWLVIHKQDKSSPCCIKIAGKEWEVTEIEALLYWYLHDEGSKIRLHFSDNAITGFVIYNRILEGVFAIRMLFVVPGANGEKIGARLSSSLEGLKTLIFQTKKDIEPKLLFKETKGREKKLSETQEMITWAMNWEIE